MCGAAVELALLALALALRKGDVYELAGAGCRQFDAAEVEACIKELGGRGGVPRMWLFMCICMCICMCIGGVCNDVGVAASAHFGSAG